MQDSQPGAAIDQGNLQASHGHLTRLLYDELRRVAALLLSRERPGVTLQPTSLVHEAFLRLAGADGAWRDKRHFVNAAAVAMRHILVDRARAALTEKHGAGREVEPLDAIDIPAAREFAPEDVEALDGALHALTAHNERWAHVVHLRFFLDLTVQQTAELLDVSEATVKSDWAFARAWLKLVIRRAREQQDGAPASPVLQKGSGHAPE
jgi:RNA polymerase sigma factor (TIGR02999 family)